jgi:hypothetical protein
MNSRAHYREELWDACCDPRLGVFCNLCGGRVLPTEAWHESHIGVPKAWGGNAVGIAHAACNQLDNIVFVTPQSAKTKRMRRRHLGITGPGLSATPLPGGRRDNVSKKLNGEVVPRIAGKGAKHRQTMAQFPNRRPEGRS